MGIIFCYEKWAKAGPSRGRGLSGVAQQYFLKISFLTQSLTEEKRKNILEKAYYTIIELQKSYSPEQDIKFLHILFNDKYKDSVRIEVFAISFILKHRNYGLDDLGRKMAIAYYEDLECQLGELYDYCIINNEYFPIEIVDCLCSDGYWILRNRSERFDQDEDS